MSKMLMVTMADGRRFRFACHEDFDTSHLIAEARVRALEFEADPRGVFVISEVGDPASFEPKHDMQVDFTTDNLLVKVYELYYWLEPQSEWEKMA